MPRQSKRLKTTHRNTSNSNAHKFYSTDPHPLGIKPLGNTLFDHTPLVRRPGLGTFSILTDEILLNLLFTLPDSTLCTLAQASKAFYTFLYTEELWKDKLKMCGGLLPDFYSSWRQTYVQYSTGKRIPRTMYSVKGMFSDYLYNAWQCASVPLEDLCSLSTENITRVNQLTVEDFESRLCKAPFILTKENTRNWPAIQTWNLDYLQATLQSKTLKAEAFDVTLENYIKYASQCQEESPLYLFDKGFVRGTSLDQDYTVPEAFKNLFELLLEERPDDKWLIIGPKRSGSTFHIDPNGTSAWNAVIKGKKKWILYPPSCPPPGVFPSPDGSQVTSPVSLVEWYMTFYDQTKKDKPVECICNEGEIMFVPSGWWHSVMNLHDSIAITQNFVSEHNLEAVLCFLRDKKDQVSGLEDAEGLYDRFIQVLERNVPELLDAWKQKQVNDGTKKTDERHGFWKETVQTQEKSAFAFSF